MAVLEESSDGYRVPMHRGRDWVVAGWLAVLLVAHVGAVEAVRRFFVHTRRGQQLDTAALAGHTIGEGQLSGPVSAVLDTVSVLSLITATVAIGFIALMRGRVLLAAAAVLVIVGANVTTQLAKELSSRPDLGIDVARVAAGNSLPSGHTTVTASVAVALVLVLPSAVRGLAAVVGGAVSALAGVATVSAGWHRPSDAVAALLVVGAWAAVTGMVLVLVRRDGAPDRGPGPTAGGHQFALLTLVMVAMALLAVAAAGLALTEQARSTPPELLSRPRLLAAYAGGAAGIAGVTSAVMAAVLVTVHRVVPPRQ